MVVNKKSVQSDRLANLYRAALYLAKGNVKTAYGFLKKTDNKIKIGNLDTHKKRLFWAEKILDQFNLLKRNLYR